ncbi:MAG TPA: methyltransferase domain-containing protein [Bryobacteraceae bacterium]|nr:methyltransferase domain-containing protein [Bryobacteraceae bacterium]
MVSFTCNVCGTFNQIENFATEPASCVCGSNVRIRASIHLLSLELFGQSLALTEFPVLKSIRAFGMTDHECYATLLAEKFSYTNTYYDREPRLDITESHPHLAGEYDFIISAEVFEHIVPPVEAAFAEIHRLLKPHGFLVATVPCPPGGAMREHFPELHQYRIVPLGDAAILVNRRRDGSLEMYEEPVFHEGHGLTLEMRHFDTCELIRRLKSSGFNDVHLLPQDDVPDLGILFDYDVSQPLIARKQEFVLDRVARNEMMGLWRSARAQLGHERRRVEQLERQLRSAAGSRWIQLGNRFGLGPRFSHGTQISSDLPLKFDAAGPLASSCLGPEWYPPEGDHRWMPPCATLRLRGPANRTQQLYLQGYYPSDRLSDGPVMVRLAVNDRALAPVPIVPDPKGSNAFELIVRPPVEAVGLPELQLAIQVNRTLSLPSDPRPLGLAFGVFELR